MLIYMILMVCIALFFYKEGAKTKHGTSTLLAEFCRTEETGAFCCKQLHLIAFSACCSAVFMAIAYVYSKVSGEGIQPVLGGLSFFSYGLGFCVALWRFFKKFTQ